MSDTTLRDLVLKRLDADTKPEDEWSALVLAALEGPDELAKLLDEEGPVRQPVPRGRHPDPPSLVRRPRPPKNRLPPHHHRRRLRGIGPKAPRLPRPRPHPRRRPQRLRQVQLRRGPRAPAHRRHLPLETAQSGRRLDAPPPQAALAADFALEGERASCTVACEWAEGPSSRPPPPGRRSRASRAPRRTPSAGRTRSRATVPSSPTTSSARSSTRARRSSTTPSPRSSA